jgi:5'-3' exonuclease
LKGDKLLIVDFYALLHRSRNALLRATGGLSTSDGRPTTGTYGFVNNLLSTIEKIKPSHVVVCYDAGSNWRKEADSEYKANRTEPENGDSFRQEALDALDDLLPALGIPVIGVKGYEADDAIYTLSRNATDFDDIVIFTCDQDLLQCVSEKTRVLLFNSAKNITDMGLDEVRESWGVNPPHVALVKALSGDSSDNIKGVRGVGQKTAAKIVVESYAILDNVLKHPKIEPFKDRIISNLELIRPTYVGELQDVDYSEFVLGGSTLTHVREAFERYEFSALLKRLSKIGKTLKMKTESQTAS